MNRAEMQIQEVPTIKLLRDRIKEYQQLRGVSAKTISDLTGIPLPTLNDLLSRPPGYKTDQLIGTLVDTVDRLESIGVNISRQDIAAVVMEWPASA